MKAGKSPLKFSVDQYRNNIGFLAHLYPMLYRSISQHSTTRMNESELKDYCLKSYHKKTVQDLSQALIHQTNELIHNIDSHLNKKDIQSITLPESGLYAYPRLFMRSIDALINQLEKQSTAIDHVELNQYRCLKEKSVVVLYGLPTQEGLAYLLKHHPIINLVIISPNIDEFLSSFILQDWAFLFTEANSGNIRLKILLSDAKNSELEYGLAWNYLVGLVPFFPLQTFYINSDPNRKENFKSLVDRIQSDMNVYLSGWGNYDDEINQLKQTIYNASRIQWVLNVEKSTQQMMPVILIGSGPSLDHHIDFISHVKGQCFIISCATSLTALHKNGIIPNLHLETESDYVRKNMLENINDLEYLQKIPLIAPIQIAPDIRKYFNRHIVYCHEGRPLSERLQRLIPMISPIGSNSLNHALHLSSIIGFQEIYCIGFDLGFLDNAQHHSKDTIYFQEDAHQLFKEGAAYKGRLFKKIQSIQGEAMLTDPFMDAARIHVERYLEKNNHLTVYNLSSGAYIKGVKSIAKDSALANITKSDTIGVSQTKNIIDKMTIILNRGNRSEWLSEIEKEKHDLIKKVNIALDDVDRILTQKEWTRQDRMLCILTKLNRYLGIELKIKEYSTYMLLKGSYFHFMMVGMLYYLTMARTRFPDEYFVNFWCHHLKKFGQDLRSHVLLTLHPEQLDDMTLLNQSLSEPEPPFRNIL